MLHRQVNFDAGIREREERHHRKRREIVQRPFEPKDGCGHTFARALKRKQCFLLSFARQNQKVPRFPPVEVAQQRARFTGKFYGVDSRIRGNSECKRDTCNRSMHPRGMNKQPKHHSGQ